MCIPYPFIFIYPACFKPIDSAVNRSCFLFKLQRSAADGSDCVVEKFDVSTLVRCGAWRWLVSRAPTSVITLYRTYHIIIGVYHMGQKRGYLKMDGRGFASSAEKWIASSAGKWIDSSAGQCYLKTLFQHIRKVFKVTSRRCYNVSGTSCKWRHEDFRMYQEHLASYLAKMLHRIRNVLHVT